MSWRNAFAEDGASFAMAEIEWGDVQGLVRRAYVEMCLTNYVVLEVIDPKPAKAWLAQLTKKIATGVDVGPQKRKPNPDDFYVNIAFTHSGLHALGMANEELGQFSMEFQEGMAPNPEDGTCPRRRTGMLGDVDESCPTKWEWGGFPGKQVKKKAGQSYERVHILLILFATTEDAMNKAMSHLVGGPKHQSGNGLNCIKSLKAYLPKDNKEHFGFKDGISQPIIEGTENARKLKETPPNLALARAGEFILGYENERQLYAVSPTTAREVSGETGLPKQGDGYDFGRNGTYLVCRQLEQDVEAFDEFLLRKTGRRQGDEGEAEREKLAAKFIGRWRNGAPLTRYPDDSEDSPEHGKYDGDKRKHANDFFFHTEDRDGLKCPVGAHIRRAYPRDSFAPDPRTALRLGKHHRILRRGRLYGPARPQDQGKAKKGTNDSKGLMFICLNADISGQFELIQHNWLNNPQFVGLYDERDPLLGQRSEGGTAMTMQRRPANTRLIGLRDFVTVRGGAYFFMPGKKALSWLANVGPAD